ncbi:unnamed protein product [Prorocentrum cordatum]|uniref:Uncharacterized protein n=1 Tax=Prorocentrum cordatum TaxID=2364126 RepID=A0ABN9RQ79_9DINO|nr:unnamed protein product [Polarella glacialis]
MSSLMAAPPSVRFPAAVKQAVSGKPYHVDLASYQVGSSAEERVADSSAIQSGNKSKRDMLMFIDTCMETFWTCADWIWSGSRCLQTCFDCKVEGASTRGSDMLDIHIFKGPKFARCGRFDYKPIWKNTSLGCPLATTSEHPRSVHCALPVAAE